MDSRRWERFLPLLVFLFALLVRLPGLGWGLKNDLRNASLHPDEVPNFGYSRAVVPGLLQFTPGFYNYGTLYLTSLRVASDVATAYTGAPRTKDGWSPADPSQTDWDWVSRCNLAGRIISVLAGAATAMVAFLLARRVAGAPAGLLAGAFVALAPAFVVHSRFQTPDALSTALIGAALYFAVRALDPKDEKARLSPATWCGIFAGLSAGVKYTGILVLVALYVALAIAKRPAWIREALVATVTALVVFFVTTPGAILDNGKFMEDFTYELKHTASGHELFFAGTSSGFIFHLTNLLIGIGPILVTMALVGLGYAAYRKHPWAFVVLAFLIPYYLLIGRAEVKFMRYTFPLYVGLALGFGYAVSAAQKRPAWGKAAIAFSILGIGGLPAGGVRDTALLTAGMMGEDPRDAAARFLKNDPLPVGLARDPWYWTPSIVPDGADPRFPAYRSRILQEVQTSTTPPIVYPLTVDGNATYFDLSLFDKKPSRISTTNFETYYPARLRGRTDLGPDETNQVNAANAWIDRLKVDYVPEQVFGLPGYGVEDMDHVRPEVTIWKRKTP